MNIIHLTQGSPEWHAHRLHHFNASDAPAMLGCSPYKTRAALIREVATGLAADVDANTQRLFDAGHRFEALARPLAEKITGEELYPVVGTSGKLSASFDGLTLMNDVAFEHKTLNSDLRDCIVDEACGNLLPLQYRVQMEQQLLIAGADKCLFMATKWDGETLLEERWTWYYANAELRAQIVAGWAQFEKDVAAYVPTEAAPVVVAEPVQALPAVLVKVTGEIAITANFGAFETALRDFLEHRLIREPKTDQDFADLDLQIKAMKGAEAALDAAESQMLAQIQTVDTAKKTKDMLAKLVRDNRLMAEKLLANEKERRKTEIVAVGQAAMRDHITALNKRIGMAMPVVHADFPGVIKGKKSLASMEDAIGTELARAKIDANRIADLIDGNRKAMDAAEAEHLFPDFAQVCTKPADDFANLIVSRKAAAQQRIEAERERIRAEEAAKLEAQQKAEAARLEREQREEADRQARELAEASARAQAAEAQATNTPEQTVQHVLKVEATSPPDTTDRDGAAASPSVGSMGAGQAADAAPALGASRGVSELPTMTLGQINARLGFTVTADFLASLGFEAHKDKSARLYRPSQFGAICARISGHVLRAASEKQAA